MEKVYSIWLVPKADVLLKRLNEEIEALSQKAGSLPFVPHVTLIGGVQCTEEEVLEKSRALATRIQACSGAAHGSLSCALRALIQSGGRFEMLNAAITYIEQ